MEAKKDGNYLGALDDKYILENLFQEDFYTSQKTLESIERRIAERKKLEYKNICNLERMRQKIESSLNTFSCFGYNPNPRMTSVKSRLETEMVHLELKKGEEAVKAFVDVERIEAEKRELLEEMERKKLPVPSLGGEE
jgi:hypothetical protein